MTRLEKNTHFCEMLSRSHLMKHIETHIALNRFGLGPKPGETQRIKTDPKLWLKSQITKSQSVPKALSKFPPSEETFTKVHVARMTSPEDLRITTRGLYRSVFTNEVIARAKHMIRTDLPFSERMVLFWSNHFTVSRTKWIVGPVIPAYEREVIRPHVFGRFSDMLKAAIQHPVMISYLDNFNSAGPNSTTGQFRIRRRGNKATLNENLAREILELHTLGVNGGYNQRDVIELAKAITGWSHGGLRFKKRLKPPDNEPVNGRFEFREHFHEPGPKEILGKIYDQGGVSEGLAVLDDLALHPSTAHFIATKLVRHFVADDPPKAAIKIISEVFLRSGGDLAQVSEALVDLDEVWTEPLTKVKSPYELAISTHRAVENINPKRGDILLPLRELGQSPFAAPSPQGWGDQGNDWISPAALMTRIEWLRRFSRRIPSTLIPSEVLQNTIGVVASQETRDWIERAPSGDAAIAMLFSSPEFQRR